MTFLPQPRPEVSRFSLTSASRRSSTQQADLPSFSPSRPVNGGQREVGSLGIKQAKPIESNQNQSRHAVHPQSKVLSDMVQFHQSWTKDAIQEVGPGLVDGRAGSGMEGRPVGQVDWDRLSYCNRYETILSITILKLFCLIILRSVCQVPG